MRDVHRDSKEQERTAARVVRRLVRSITAGGVPAELVRWGNGNKVMGLSGYRHQIDVSVHLPDHIFLYECKRLDKKVGLAHVLTLLGRMKDIQPVNRHIPVHGILITNGALSKNAKRVADTWEIEHHRVDNEHEWALSLMSAHSVGLRDRVRMGDAVSYSVD